MKPGIKTKWVAALRSGEYKQGTRQLLRGDGSFCCLGVLTDLAVKDGVGDWDHDYYPEASFLPQRVVKWAGLDTRSPCVAPSWGTREALWSLNDSSEHGFEELADLIEEQL